MITPVILAGGNGQRLWPISTPDYPKPFIPILDGNSLFQRTVSRLKELEIACPPIIVCNKRHRIIVENQLRKIGTKDFLLILEPEGRDSAPAAALAAIAAEENQSSATLLIMPADHMIGNLNSLKAGVENGLNYSHNNIVTFGLLPTRASCEYGYIEKGEILHEIGINKILRFTEKPAQDLANTFFQNGTHLWNSGIFLTSAKHYLSELAIYAPNIIDPCQKAFPLASGNDSLKVIPDIFNESEALSIDYAIMEHSQKTAVIELDCALKDIGSWSTLFEMTCRDRNNNATRGKIFSENTSGCYLHASTRPVVVAGLQDCIVVESVHGVLVAKSSSTSAIKSLVSQLITNNSLAATTSKEYLSPENNDSQPMLDTVYRPWGYFKDILLGNNFRVKLLVVNAKSRLSLQYHNYRSEHWTVISGKGKAEISDKYYDLEPGLSLQVPLGAVHRITNNSEAPLELIEVQTGTYIDEEDIVRLEDKYGRVSKGTDRRAT